MYVLYLLEQPEVQSRNNPNKTGIRRLVQYDPLNNADLNDGAFIHTAPPPPIHNSYRGYSEDLKYEDFREFSDHRAPPPPLYEEMSGPVNTSVMVVSSGDAGAIIGTGGRNINVVRQRSRAEIRVEDTKDDGQTRNVNITGTDSQIEYAKFLIQQFINEDKADRRGPSRGVGGRGRGAGRGRGGGGSSGSSYGSGHQATANDGGGRGGG